MGIIARFLSDYLTVTKFIKRFLMLFIIIPVFSSAASYWSYYNSYNHLPLVPKYKNELDLESYFTTGEPKSRLPDEIFLKDKEPVLIPEGGASWKISIPKSGFYTLFLEYLFYTDVGEEGLSVYIDEKLPFDEAISILPARFYRNNTAEREQPIRSSALAPMPAVIWQSRFAGDTSGKAEYPYKFYLSAGEHTITLKPLGGKWFINSFIVESYEPSLTLKEYRKQNPIELTASRDTRISLDGASYSYQYGEVDAMVYMDLEADPMRQYNSLGRWRYPGNGVIWEFDIEEEGYYRVAFRYALGNIPLFKTALGDISYKGFQHSERLLLVDGKVPFKEAETLVFQPTDSGKSRDTNYWYLYSPQFRDDKEMLYLELYLTRGTHTIELIPNLKNRRTVLSLLDELFLKLATVEDGFKEALGIEPNPNLSYPLTKATILQIEELLSQFVITKKQVNLFSKGSQVESSLNDLLNRLTNLALLKEINTGHLVEITRMKDSLRRTINISQLMPLNIDSIELFSPNNNKIIVNFRDESWFGKLKNYIRYRVKI